MNDWEDLRHFAALARDKSLSAAARRLGVDHATVARRIAALEASLQLKLVDRRPRAYVLTADGERIATLAARMEEEAYAVERAAGASRAGLAGTVTISAPPGIANTLIAPRLGELLHRHPGLVVRLIGEKRSASLSRREADVAVRLSRPDENSLVARKVGSMAFGLYAAPEYLAQRTPAQYGFIAYDESMKDAPQQLWLKAIAGARPIIAQINDLDGQRAAARAGVGVAALPLHMGEGDAQLRRIEAKGKPVAREVWLAVHRDMRRAPPVRAALDFLAACFA
ncbi:MAG TPA: LysR family transcriptional regulator [Burkholderiales bacterium]